MTVHGQDWASYQSNTPSTRGLDFAFIKATEATGYVNPRMSAQAAHARAAGCVVGFYHFLHPGNVKRQAAYFVAKAASLEHDPLFVDWENVPGGDRASCADKDAFIREVQRLRPGHRVGLYCNRDFWLNRDTSSFAGDALWIADYVAAGKPHIQADWLFHQYTSTPVDTNVGDFKDRAALVAWAGGTSTSTDTEEDDMQLTDQVKLNEWVPKKWPDDDGLKDGKIYVSTALGSGYGYARQAAQNSAAVLAQLGAQQATIDKLVTVLGAGGGLTAAEIQAAAEAGAQAALTRLGDALTTEGDK